MLPWALDRTHSDACRARGAGWVVHPCRLAAPTPHQTSPPPKSGGEARSLALSGSERIPTLVSPEGPSRPDPACHNPKAAPHRTAHSPGEGERDRPRWLGCVPKAAPRPRFRVPRKDAQAQAEGPEGSSTAGPCHPKVLGASSPLRHPEGSRRDFSRKTPKGRRWWGERAESAGPNPRKDQVLRPDGSSRRSDPIRRQDDDRRATRRATPGGATHEPTGATPERVAPTGEPPHSEERGNSWLRPIAASCERPASGQTDIVSTETARTEVLPETRRLPGRRGCVGGAVVAAQLTRWVGSATAHRSAPCLKRAEARFRAPPVETGCAFVPEPPKRS